MGSAARAQELRERSLWSSESSGVQRAHCHSSHRHAVEVSRQLDGLDPRASPQLVVACFALSCLCSRRCDADEMLSVSIAFVLGSGSVSLRIVLLLPAQLYTLQQQTPAAREPPEAALVDKLQRRHNSKQSQAHVTVQTAAASPFGVGVCANHKN